MATLVESKHSVARPVGEARTETSGEKEKASKSGDGGVEGSRRGVGSLGGSVTGIGTVIVGRDGISSTSR